jgi:hypothetical protein
MGNFTFAYAVMAQNPGHGPGQDPYFNVRVDDLTTTNNLYNVIDYTTSFNPNNPCAPWCLGTTGVVYRCWTTVQLDLSAFAGHTVRVSLLASDCAPNGHWGDAFLDNVDFVLPPMSSTNKDLCNNTNQTADCIEIVLAGTYPASSVIHYDGPYYQNGGPVANTTFPNFVVVPSGSNTILRWSGQTFAPSARCHVGFQVPAVNGAAKILAVRWTFGATILGCAHQLNNHAWNANDLPVVFANDLTLCTRPIYYVGNISVEYYVSQISLADLNSGVARTPDAQYNLNLSPISVPVDSSVSVTVPQGPANARFGVLVYEVSTSPTLQDPANTVDYVQLPLAAGPISAVPGSSPWGMVLLAIMLLTLGSGLLLRHWRASA